MDALRSKTDNRTNFASKLVKKLNNLIYNESFLSMPYHHNTNGNVEQVNKNLMKIYANYPNRSLKNDTFT